MRDKLITEMSTEEFDAVIDAYIEREAQDTGELPAPMFYQTLRDIFGPEAAEETIELQGEWEGDRLRLLPPMSPLVAVRDNEIVVDNIRLIIHVTPRVAQAA